MLGSGSLEIAIGIFFVYLLLSLVCTSIMEVISSVMNQRGKTLFEGVKNLLNDPNFTGLAQQLYSHGLVSSISEYASNPSKPNRLPSYVPSKILSSALVDILCAAGGALNPIWKMAVDDRQKALAQAQAAVEARPGDATLAAAAKAAEDAFNRAQAMQVHAEAIGNRFDEARKAAEAVKGQQDFKGIQAAATQFAVALNEGRALATQIPDPLENIESAIRKHIPAGHTQDSLLLLLEKTRRDTATVKDAAGYAAQRIEAFQTNIEQWYNQAMDRVTGWYKRWTQVVLIFISAIAVAGANADTIMLAQVLSQNDTLRASLAGAATEFVQAGQPTASTAASDAAPKDLAVMRAQALQAAQTIDLPLGWTSHGPTPTDLPSSLGGWLLKILGLVISIAAVSLGAPFWFDTLSKFVNIRGAGTPPGQHSKSAPQPKVPK